MAGKGLAAQHQEIADDAGHDGDHAARREGPLHEIIGEDISEHDRDADRVRRLCRRT